LAAFANIVYKISSYLIILALARLYFQFANDKIRLNIYGLYMYIKY